MIAPVPAPPVRVIVGADSYPTPGVSRTIDPTLPSCSSNTGVTAAGVVGSSYPVVSSSTVGRVL